MSIASDVLPTRELLSFLLFDWLGTCKGEDEKDTLLAVMDMSSRLAIDAFLPHHRQADIQEPKLDGGNVHILPAIHEALRQYRELGFFGSSFPEEVGGLGFSCSASLTLYSIFAAANISTAAYPMLTAANARLLTTFGTERQVEVFALPQIEGRWFGTMCLSEPQAGSSLGDIRTRAKAEGEDEYGPRYRITGNKMWISGGDQDASENIVHLVLAKAVQPDGRLPEGTKGISLFIVPKWLPDGARNDLAIAGLNHKLGYRGTANCLLNFGEGDGAVGWRVGGEGQGLAQMFMMMNEARISVGAGAAALAYRGYRQSLNYAKERRQGRLTGTQGGEQIPIIDHPDVRRMLLQQKVYAEGALALCFYCANLVDSHTTESETLLSLLTPVAKSWPSEFGLMANDLAIQIHGGYGYTRDFDVELLWRDNRLNPIHEGTTGIQAVDLLRRKILMSDGGALARLMAQVRETALRAGAVSDLAGLGTDLAEFWDRIDGAVVRLQGVAQGTGLADAVLFLRAFGHGVVAWLWLDQMLCVKGGVGASRRQEVEQACRFFFRSELPQAAAWLSIASESAGQPDSISVDALS